MLMDCFTELTRACQLNRRNIWVVSVPPSSTSRPFDSYSNSRFCLTDREANSLFASSSVYPQLVLCMLKVANNQVYFCGGGGG